MALAIVPAQPMTPAIAPAQLVDCQQGVGGSHQEFWKGSELGSTGI